MTRDDLTREQAKALADRLFPVANYLFRLKARMEKKRFEPEDPLFVKVVAAYNAVCHLRTEVLYLAASGTGRPELRSEKDSANPPGLENL